MTQRCPPNPLGSTIGAHSLASAHDEEKCRICEESLFFESQECYNIITCGHIFHRICVEQALSTSAECPHCKLPCDLSDLRKYSINTNVIDNASAEISTQTANPKKSKPLTRGKGRGAMANRPVTRNLSKALFNENFESDGTPRPNVGHLIDVSHQYSPLRNTSSNQIPTQNNPNDNNFRPPSQNVVEIDYSKINNMIENNIAKFFQNLNLQPHLPPNTHPSAIPVPPVPIPNNSGLNNDVPLSNVNSCRNSTSQMEQFISARPEKLTSIIQNWNVKFDGSSTGLTVEEFLYRIKSLTQEHFGNNFTIICKNLPVLLTGKAREWYWRYHKQVDSIEWTSFCAALKCQFKDMR